MFSSLNHLVVRTSPNDNQKKKEHTFLRQPPPLMRLKSLFSTFPLYRSITLRPCEIQHHRLIKEFKSINFLNRLTRSLDILKDDKRLSFGFQIALRDDFEDGAVFGEQLGESFGQFGGFDAFFEVADVDTSKMRCDVSLAL